MGNRRTNPETSDGELVVLVATDQNSRIWVYGPFESESERRDLAEHLRKRGRDVTTVTMTVPFSEVD